MSETLLVLPEGDFELNSDITYQVYGEAVYAIDIMEMDLTHLCWLDQLTVLQDLHLMQEISILYHPEIVSSLYSEAESSQYWGKDKYETLAQYNRTQTKNVTEEKDERRMMKPIVWTATMTSKQGKIVGRLVNLGYDRLYSRDLFKRFMAEKGEGYMNLTVNTVAGHIDEFARDVSTETGGKYIRKDSQKPCTIYLIRFTNNSTGETFVKVGITSRELGERFVTDKKHYDIDIIHVAEHAMSECVEREKAIQDRYKAFRYVPEKRLSNNGTTEIMRSDAPINEIIILMGNNKIK
jgi:hypothetical protein